VKLSVMAATSTNIDSLYISVLPFMSESIQPGRMKT
jgi:hypothetical protein